MKKLLLASLVTAVYLSGTAQADTKSYTPPAKTGYVYIIGTHNVNPFGHAKTADVNINWGSWSRSGSIKSVVKSGCSLDGGSGFVIRLYHSKADSYPITASSNGNIKRIYQGSQPRPS